MTDELDSLKRKLQDALTEIDQLRQENEQLRQTVKAPHPPADI